MKAYDGAKPSVGRVVHYYMKDDSEPLASIVTKVHSSTSAVDAVFFPPASGVGPLVGGLIAIEFSEEPKAGHWTWPPRV